MSNGEESVPQVQRGEDAELVVLPDADESLVDLHLRANLVNPFPKVTIIRVKIISQFTNHSPDPFILLLEVPYSFYVKSFTGVSFNGGSLLFDGVEGGAAQPVRGHLGALQVLHREVVLLQLRVDPVEDGGAGLIK